MKTLIFVSCCLTLIPTLSFARTEQIVSGVPIVQGAPENVSLDRMRGCIAGLSLIGEHFSSASPKFKDCAGPTAKISSSEVERVKELGADEKMQMALKLVYVCGDSDEQGKFALESGFIVDTDTSADHLQKVLQLCKESDPHVTVTPVASN